MAKAAAWSTISSLPRMPIRARFGCDFSGEARLRVDAAGDLVIGTDAGEIRWKRPEIYQDTNGKRTSIAGRFVLNRSRVRFEIAAYDQRAVSSLIPRSPMPLTSAVAANEYAKGIGLDSAGNIYIAGTTSSNGLPTTSALQRNFGGAGAGNPFGDAFVAKFSPAGALLYLTYLGGSSNDGAIALAVDASGNAYVAGATTSQDFPTKNAFQAGFHGGGGTGEVVTGDAFVAKLNPSGNQLLYSTYLGGSMDDIANAIVVDGSGNAYVGGASLSLNFPITGSAYQKIMKGYGGEPISPSTGLPGWDPGDAFVVKLNTAVSWRPAHISAVRRTTWLSLSRWTLRATFTSEAHAFLQSASHGHRDFTDFRRHRSAK